MSNLVIVVTTFLVFGVFNWGVSNAYLHEAPSEVERTNQHNFALQAAILGPIATITVIREADFPKHGFRWW